MRKIRTQIFCWATKSLGDQSGFFASGVSPASRGPSTADCPWPGGHLEEGRTWDAETGGEQTHSSYFSFQIPSRLKACFNLLDFLLFSFQHLVWKAVFPAEQEQSCVFPYTLALAACHQWWQLSPARVPHPREGLPKRRFAFLLRCCRFFCLWVGTACPCRAGRDLLHRPPSSCLPVPRQPQGCWGWTCSA